MRQAARSLVKSLVFSALGSPPMVAAKLRAVRRSGALTILNLHRVGPDDGSAYQPLSPTLFEALLRFVLRHFTVTTFAGLSRLDSRVRPPLILSFDDGYADFAEFAAPALERHGLAANLNIIPDCMETGEPPLGVLLQDFAGRAPLEALDRIRVEGFAANPRQIGRTAFGNRLGMAVTALQMAEQQALAERLRPIIQSVPDFAPTPMLTIAQLRELAARHEIGAHSFNHASMALESDDYLRADLARCGAWLRHRLGLPLRIYAFPNGSRRAGQVETVIQAGVEHVLLVDERFSDPGKRAHPRFTYYARSVAETWFRATGGSRWPRRTG